MVSSVSFSNLTFQFRFCMEWWVIEKLIKIVLIRDISPTGEPPQPTAVELQLPWKRVDENDASTVPVIQSEFPLWVENKEYTHYYSPTNTFLGNNVINITFKQISILACHRWFGKKKISPSYDCWDFQPTTPVWWSKPVRFRCASLRDRDYSGRELERIGTRQEERQRSGVTPLTVAIPRSQNVFLNLI